MKNLVFNTLFILLVIALFSPACTVTVEDDADPDPTQTLSQMNSFGFVYDEIEFVGTGFDGVCNNVSASLSIAGVDQDLQILDCTETTIIALIPADMPVGLYDVTLNVGNNTFTEINGAELKLEVRIRPVILSMTPTSVAPGGTIVMTGLNIINDSGNAGNDPKVWLTQVGYTNTVHDITVNAAGTEATIVISDNISPGPGLYNIKLTCVEWSNELEITIL